MSLPRPAVAAVAFGLVIAALHGRVMAFPVEGDQTALPVNTELNGDALMRPREVFRSEATGRKSYLVNLGNLAFSSPSGHRFPAQSQPRSRRTIGRQDQRIRTSRRSAFFKAVPARPRFDAFDFNKAVDISYTE